MTRPSYYDEIFCSSDDGDPDCLYWLSATDRTEDEAVRIVEQFVGEFPEGVLVSTVTGYVGENPEGLPEPYFHKSAAVAEAFWEVTSA